MTAGIYDIYIEQNATFQLDLYWSNNASPPVPINVAGYTARCEIRPQIGSTTVLAALCTTGLGGTFPGGTPLGTITMGSTDGHIQLLFSATVTAGFTWVTGVYDLEITAPGGFATRILQGNVTVSPAVTL